MKLTVGSLFSGIGGIDLGLERAGMQVLWQVECEPYARKVLSKNFPGVPCFDDVRAVTGADVPRVDVLCGGFPCQDISVAGKGAGIQEGTRSGLWGEFARLIREIRPRYVLVENVAALLARGLGRVLGDLAASGYDAEWDCIPAAALGAPHRRDRLFLVAYPFGDALREQPESEPGGIRANEPRLYGSAGDVAYADRQGQLQQEGPVSELRRRAVHGGSEGRAMANTHDAGRRQQRLVFTDGAEQLAAQCRRGWATEPNVGRMAHGIPKRVDRLRTLGNAVVPQVAEYVGRLIVSHAEAA